MFAYLPSRWTYIKNNNNKQKKLLRPFKFFIGFDLEICFFIHMIIYFFIEHSVIQNVCQALSSQVNVYSLKQLMAKTQTKTLKMSMELSSFSLGDEAQEELLRRRDM